MKTFFYKLNTIRLVIKYFIGLPRWLSSKESACSAGGAGGDTSSVPGSGRSPGGGNGNSLQYSCLGNPMEEEPGRLKSKGLQKSQT